MPDGPVAIGPWPASPPIPAHARAALWLDGSLAGAVAAGWLERHGVDWLALLPAMGGKATGAVAALLAGLAGVGVPLAGADDATELASLARAADVARANGASWLVLPYAAHHDGEGAPLALRLAEAERALSLWRPVGLYAPLLRRTWPELGRLALALGLRPEVSWDCRLEVACGTCEGCLGRRRALVAAGLERG